MILSVLPLTLNPVEYLKDTSKGSFLLGVVINKYSSWEKQIRLTSFKKKKVDIVRSIAFSSYQFLFILGKIH